MRLNSPCTSSPNLTPSYRSLWTLLPFYPCLSRLSSLAVVLYPSRNRCLAHLSPSPWNQLTLRHRHPLRHDPWHVPCWIVSVHGMNARLDAITNLRSTRFAGSLFRRILLFAFLTHPFNLGVLSFRATPSNGLLTTSSKFSSGTSPLACTPFTIARTALSTCLYSISLGTSEKVERLTHTY